MRSRCRSSSLNFKSCRKTLAREVIANARQIHLIALMNVIKSIVKTRRSNDVCAIIFRDLRLRVLRHRPTAGLQTKFNISSKNTITFINNTPSIKQICFSQQCVSLVDCKQHELLRLDNNERVSSSPGRPRADLAQLTSNATPITARPAASPQVITRLQNTLVFFASRFTEAVLFVLRHLSIAGLHTKFKLNEQTMPSEAKTAQTPLRTEMKRRNIECNRMTVIQIIVRSFNDFLRILT